MCQYPPKYIPKNFHPSRPPYIKILGVQNWGSPWGPLPSLYNNPSDYTLWGISEGGIRAIIYPNPTNPKIVYNQEILKFVKSHFFQQKNQNFFVMLDMETIVIPLDHKPFGQYPIKILFQNYERLSHRLRFFEPAKFAYTHCIKSEKTLKFGVGSICKIDFVIPI